MSVYKNMHFYSHFDLKQCMASGIDLKGTGIPTRRELLSLYSGANPKLDQGQIMSWRGFYLAFLFFKNCVIVHGVKQRASLGVASSAMAKKVGTLLPTMVGMTKEIWNKEPPPNSLEAARSKL
mmetsp:Transcript_16991/g.24694  ORF Transcript_16991/g.24694 Transcript_16991/m.24694 type:complete len:123 (+) Transcript_16991:283-651(+)